MIRNLYGRTAEVGLPIAGESFVGGVRLPGFDATWPLVRLNLAEHGLRLHASAQLLKSVVPTWEALFSELIQVRAVGRVPVFLSGIRFRIASGEWVVFWSMQRALVLDAISRRGVAVDPEPHRFHFTDPNRD